MGRKSLTNQSTLLRTECLLWTVAALCFLPLAVTASARWFYAENSYVQHVSTSDPLPGTTPSSVPQTDLSHSFFSELVALETSHPDKKSAADQVGTEYAVEAIADWSEQRRAALATLLSKALPPRIATLHLPSVPVSIPVFAGEGEAQMTLGAGHLLDSAPLDATGNAALSSHRDGPFRALRQLQIGDQIDLLLDQPPRVRSYRIRNIAIVEPTDISVLQPTSTATLTLITCYPFYFVGNAPQRYIVSAELVAGEKLPRFQAQRSPNPSFSKIEKEMSDV